MELLLLAEITSSAVSGFQHEWTSMCPQAACREWRTGLQIHRQKNTLSPSSVPGLPTDRILWSTTVEETLHPGLRSEPSWTSSGGWSSVVLHPMSKWCCTNLSAGTLLQQLLYIVQLEGSHWHVETGPKPRVPQQLHQFHTSSELNSWLPQQCLKDHRMEN